MINFLIHSEKKREKEKEIIVKNYRSESRTGGDEKYFLVTKINEEKNMQNVMHI